MKVLTTVAVLVAVYLTIAMIAMCVLKSRVDDLEKAMTTFESVRIEMVAPAKDSG